MHGGKKKYLNNSVNIGTNKVSASFSKKPFAGKSNVTCKTTETGSRTSR